MSALGFLVPLAVVLGAVFVGLFVAALRDGQWEDLDGAARRAIEEEPEARGADGPSRRG